MVREVKVQWLHHHAPHQQQWGDLSKVSQSLFQHGSLVHFTFAVAYFRFSCGCRLDYRIRIWIFDEIIAGEFRDMCIFFGIRWRIGFLDLETTAILWK
jgi:hypothetical protein